MTISTIFSVVMLGIFLLLLIYSTTFVMEVLLYSYFETVILGLINGAIIGLGYSLTSVTMTVSSSFLKTALISLVVFSPLTTKVYSLVLVLCLETTLVI